MAKITRKDRIKGTIMGALIGDALGVGPHWYYDLKELKEIYGQWIDDYVQEQPGRYHPGLKPGDNSQTGQVMILLLESVAECGGYEEDDFTCRLDELFTTLDGTPQGGRYTDSAMRSVWRARNAGYDWSEAGSFEDTAEASIRIPVLAARYVDDLELSMNTMMANIQVTHRDPFIVGQSTAFGLNICALVNGVGLARAANVLSALREPADRRALPDEPHAKGPSIPGNWIKNHGISFKIPVDWLGLPEEAGKSFVPPSSFYDSIGQSRASYLMTKDPEITIEPASAACRVFGLSCTAGFMYPAAYYFAARFENDFEMAVLSAINGGGNNMARAALTGALSGAQVGLSGIPKRFITGLTGHERLLELAGRVAEAAGSG
ncbi:MAG: ADP-ribosylglycohydrolase family protein [Anaerolineales bacterium]|nr:ADP-ribosylglycohydrolase family protein [Anaerolineales bacterium]